MERRQAESGIDAEIRAEKAAALRRAVRTLEAALARFSGSRPGSRERADLLAEAAERLWYVVIHREAMGLTRHETLYEVLAVPAEVRRRMGPRPRGR